MLNVIRFLLCFKPRSQSDFALLCETIQIAKKFFFHVLVKQDDAWYVITTHSNYNKNENIRKRVQTTCFLRQKIEQTSNDKNIS